MPALTLKNIPESLLDKLRRRADEDRRSLTQEVLYLLEQAVDERPATAPGFAPPAAEAQARAWMRLCGRWRSDLTAADEIRDVYDHRTPGRNVSL
jgi:plasmid stability protein